MSKIPKLSLNIIKHSFTKTKMSLVCDYLVVGAGAASMSFIDTLLTEIPSAKIILVDQKHAPGGHWVDDYGYVQLHQPSLLYGVASRQLEGNWMKVMLYNRTLPWNHRANKKEIGEYFNSFVKDKVASGQLEYYPCCKYKFGQRISDDAHSFSTLNSEKTYSVQVKAKLVNGILGECKIPSQCPVDFPVDEGINLITPNDLYDVHTSKSPVSEKYVVLGNGKTAMDTIVYLQRAMKVNPTDISWIISRDVWMLSRGDSKGGPWAWPQALLENNGDFNKSALASEERGNFVRLDKNVTPTAFRFPVIGKDELILMRKIKNIVRRGRVTAIRFSDDNASLEFGKDQSPWPTHKDALFIHCTSPGPFNGREFTDVFVSENELNLPLLFAPPVSISMSCMGFLEAARSKGKLDIDFGRKLIEAENSTLSESPSPKSMTENEVMRLLIQEFDLGGDEIRRLVSIVNLAMFICLADRDPMVGYNWHKENRLSFLSVPGFKCKIYENMKFLASNGKSFGFEEGKIRMFELLRDKLECLEGK